MIIEASIETAAAAAGTGIDYPSRRSALTIGVTSNNYFVITPAAWAR